MPNQDAGTNVEATTATDAAADAAATAVAATPPAKYTQADLDRIMARKLDAERKEWSGKLQAEQAARAAQDERIKELETNGKGEAETVEAIKKARKADAEKWTAREAELLRTNQETQTRWDHEKVISAITAAVPSKVQDALRPLLIEHLVGRSKVVDGKVVYTDPDTMEDLTPEAAVARQLASKPALVIGPAMGSGGRPGTVTTIAPAKDRSKMSADELWARDEAEAKAARAKK